MSDDPASTAFARPRVAAGALFMDETGRVMLVQPKYKDHWDIPGGYVEPGESPRAACIREVREELSLALDHPALLVADWAPSVDEGDKLLFVFDAGILDADQRANIKLAANELVNWRLVPADDLDQFVTDRLVRRIRTAVDARRQDRVIYAEHGQST